MALYRIIYLLLSSLLILSSCALGKYRRAETKNKEIITANNLVPVVPAEGASKYKAGIDVLNKHFSGIIVLKQTEPDVRHLVFVTELGMRMFDFVMRGDSITPEFVFEPLNKPKLINALVNSFKDVLLVGVFNKEASVKKGKDSDFYLLNTGRNNIVIVKDAANFTTINKVFSGRKRSSRTIYNATYAAIDYKTYGLVKLKIRMERLMDK
jgi:hypothetical protein